MTTHEIKHLLKTDSKATVKAAKYFATYYVAGILGKNATKFTFGGVVNVSKKMLVVSIVQNILKYKKEPTFKQLNLLKDFLLTYEPSQQLLSEVISGKIEKGFYPITDNELLAFDSSYITDGHKTH